MPVRTRKELSASLKKGELASAYYLFGSEDVLKEEIVRAILDRSLDPASRDFNFDQRAAGSLDPEAVESLCYTLPMMADRRVVLIRDVEAWKRKPKARAAVIRYLERPSAETVVILVQGPGEDACDKDFSRLALTVECDGLTAAEALKWLSVRAASAGIAFEAGAAEHLLKCVGPDLGLLRLEIEKLSSLPGGIPITVAQVGDMVGIQHGETQYDWRDAVMDGDAGRAVTLLGRVLEQSGISGVKLVTLLGATLIGVGVTRAAYDRKLRGRALEGAAFDALRAARPFGLGPWKDETERWARWAPDWPERRIRAALRATLDADRAIKSTTISDDRGLLADLVMQLVLGAA
ncbi:MAG: DNA polymerase III subunit delta, partial [Gemmatimonadales bacterium]|nr:DNA polymerase III subunit delta [Gemmatimonadales bacterium]